MPGPDSVGDINAALKWLFGFADWERGVGWNPAAAPDEQWKLGRTRTLLDLAGAPDRELRTVLVAGTKGKGSTAAMLEAIAGRAGWRTGLYTQPHFHSYLERVRLDGRPIDAPPFVTLVDRLRALVGRLHEVAPEAGEPTTFELTTALAVLAFAAARVDLAILEVGLGGRLDATNAVDPLLSIITTIGLDHTHILGESIEAIAREKAGIIRAGGTVISALQRPAARRAIVGRCAELQARCRFVRPLPLAPDSGRRDGEVVVRVGRVPAVRARLAMPGPHQRQNAAVALAAAEELAPQGLALTAEAVRAGLGDAHLPGRVEIVPGSPTWVVDAAHNRDSALALAATLREAGVGRPRYLVLGILRDKDACGVVAPLLVEVDGVLVTAPASRRALPAEALAELCRSVGAPVVATVPTVAEAIERARVLAGPSGVVVAAGSFSVAAEARAALRLARSGPA